ncbi:Metaxin-1 [Liparis tanakae]|uniref:Metaxin-1 n=1 Tax=Liparis tanakae TaxID=230148 RepID=A0A4Z2EDV2_9TELE|nr:Metaxin-1 [Liparis tanakae]
MNSCPPHRPLILSGGSEAYAQFAGAPLKVRKMSNPWRSPSGLLPTLRTNRKENLTRPSDIITHFRKQVTSYFKSSPLLATRGLWLYRSL